MARGLCAAARTANRRRYYERNTASKAKLKPYLNLASTIHADFLVTGDSDLLVLKRHFGTLIIPFNEFINIIS
jgi:predicted nucleic acid-binding protein